MYEQVTKHNEEKDLYIVDLNPFASLQESTADVVVVMDHLNQRKSSEQVAANVSFDFHNLCQCIF